MKILLKEKNVKIPYATLDPGVMDVELEEVFNGVTLISPNGEKLGICMRDGGFEVHYFGPHRVFDDGWIQYKDGKVSRMENV